MNRFSSEKEHGVQALACRVGLFDDGSHKLKPKSADKKLAKSISLNIHRRFGDFSRFRLFTQRVKGQKDEKPRGYWVKPHFPNPYRRIWAKA
ncbi:MAG: hypothetical protein ACREAM_09840 [Blastocatellia bacterium]